MSHGVVEWTSPKKRMNETWLNVFYLIVYCLLSCGYILRSCLKAGPARPKIRPGPLRLQPTAVNER